MSKKHPHDNVFVRLASSKLHGVGVFAIRPIKKGTYVFGDDDVPLVWVKKASVKNLPKEIKRLYEDFCILKGDKYGCPDNFNNLTSAWYLNDSSNPNVAADNEYKFYAIRNIKKGEELTANYSTYSD
jgi:SET domain-containing protein